jgi:hypothetical protein
MNRTRLDFKDAAGANARIGVLSACGFILDIPVKFI